MSAMKVDTLPIGLYQENTYVLHDQGHVLIIDPGGHAEYVAAAIKNDETVDAILLTHGHEDHTAAADDLYDLYHCPIYLHPGDAFMVDPKYGTGSFSRPVYSPIQKFTEGKMKIGAFDLDILFTPGHSKGSVCVLYRNRLFSGDTLFAGSIGRTDLEGGDDAEMVQSLKRLRELPGDLWVYPGHGYATTIAQEKETNPFLHYLRADLY